MIDASLPPEHCFRACLSHLSSETGPLVVLWAQVTGSRTEFQTELTRLSQGHPIVSIFVQATEFEHPNGIMSDLAGAIKRSRHDIEAHASSVADTGKLLLLLLSKAELALPQVSSPALLPEWFPIHAGAQVHVTIQDISWTVEAPLNAVEARIGEVCGGLYALEVALIGRLRYVHTSRHTAGAALFELIRLDANEKYGEFLQVADDKRRAVTNPSGFRPSVRDAQTVIGRLLRIVSSTSPDGLNKPAKALGAALNASAWAEAVRDSFPSVLFRSTDRNLDVATACGRNLLVTIYAAYQYVTAAAHADVYPQYPVALLRAASYDLRAVMQSIEVAMELTE